MDAIIGFNKESRWICPCDDMIPKYDTWAIQPGVGAVKYKHRLV